jgi:hypothetical protein
VQDAILHNKRIFEHRMMMESRSTLKKAWDAWKGARYGSVAKQQKLRRALNRIAKGTLSRAFFAWKERYGLKDKTHAMKKKVRLQQLLRWHPHTAVGNRHSTLPA